VDNFANKEADIPGPGDYIQPSTIGKNMKGVANMGSKYKTVFIDTPGPGAYNENQNLIRSRQTSNCKIGTSARPEIWDTTKAAKEVPGPGNYMESTDTFGKNVKGAATMGSKHKPE